MTKDTAEIQRIIRDYLKQLYANKMHNLEEMDKFLEKYSLSQLYQEEIENMKRPIASNEKNSQQTKVQDKINLQVNSTKYLKKS